MDMLNWICPGCGRECLPATRECPACAEAAAEGGQAGSVAEHSTSVAALAAALAVGQEESRSGGVAGSVATATALLEPPEVQPVAESTVTVPAVPSEPEPRPALDQDLKTVRSLIGERISRVQRQYAQGLLDVHTPALREPELEQEFRQAVIGGLILNHQKIAGAALRAEAEEHWDARLAESAANQLTPVIDIWEAAQRVHAEELWRARIDEEARRQRERRLRELEGAISTGKPDHISEPVRPAPAVAQGRESAWEREVARQREATAAEVAEDASLAMRVYAREMLDTQTEAAVQLAHQQAVQAIAQALLKPPAFALIAVPTEILLAPVRIAGHRNIGLDRFSPYPPKPMDDSALNSEFATSTPLPAKAQSQLQTEKPRLEVEQKRIFPPWVLVAVAVAATSIVVMNFFHTGDANADRQTIDDPTSTSVAAKGSPAKPSPAVSQAPGAISTTSGGSVFAKEVEVSGLRIGVDLLHRSQLQYVVVNHSGAQLSGVVLHIKVTSNAPTNKGTLFQVSAVVPSLGPNESKEIRTDIEGQLQSKPIPAWRYLKTDVQVDSQ